MNKTALLHEAKQQQQALRQLSLWKRIAMLLSSCAAVLAWWGIAGSGLRFAGGVLFGTAGIKVLASKGAGKQRC